MSWTLLDFTCKSLEGESFGHMFCRNSNFCFFLSHKSYKGSFIDPEYWNIMSSPSNINYSRDETGKLICIKPCKYCIIDFILKRLTKQMITRYRRVKKYKQYLLNIKNLRNRELTGR